MTQSLSVQAIKTPIFRDGDLVDFIVSAIPESLVTEEMVLVITSKIVSISEKRIVPLGKIDKKELIQKEADIFFGEIGYGSFLTVKEGLLIASAGIDESNSESGGYILYPQNPTASAQKIRAELCKRWGLKKLGIILSDSHTTALRRGVTGIALSFWGFQPLRKMIGTQDLFGRPLKMTNMNLVDGIAASAVMMMGEGSEMTPLALVKGVQLEFCDQPESLTVPLEDDLYAPLLKSFLNRCRV